MKNWVIRKTPKADEMPGSISPIKELCRPNQLNIWWRAMMTACSGTARPNSTMTKIVRRNGNSRRAKA
ncbi:hypothetical protein D3C87_1992200 [compost metagenome]